MMNNMARTPWGFHGVYKYDIAYKLVEHKHLSCIMPTVMLLYPLVTNIADIFNDNKRITVIVRDSEEIDEINKLLFAINQEDSLIFPITVQDFLEQEPETEVYIVFDLNQKDRMEVGKVLIPKTKRIVISVGQPELSNLGDGKDTKVSSALGKFAMLTTKELTVPYPLVFPVHSVVDIRDIMFANVEEKSELISQLQDLVRRYQYEADKLNTQKKQEAVNEEIEKLKKQLEFYEKLNAAMILVSESAGICKEEIQDAAEKLVVIKDKYETKCVNADGSENEEAISQMQNETAIVLSEITNRKLTRYSRDAFERQLIELLTPDVWKRISSSSKSYLISARMNYEAMLSSESSDSVDYSGVCLQVTKALDEEMAERVYNRYKSYLTKMKQINDTDSWPTGMVVRKRGQETLASPEDFTLGSIAFTIGVDGRGQVRNNKDYAEFCKYAAAVLYKPTMSKAEIQSRIKDLVITVERVRKDFRNPSAHRAMLPKRSAEECMNYMIDQLKKLKSVLEDMVI